MTEIQPEIAGYLRKLASEPELLEVARKAIADALADLRDRGVGVRRSNGLVIKTKEGRDSDMIRMGPEVAVRIALCAIAERLEASERPKLKSSSRFEKRAAVKLDLRDAAALLDSQRELRARKGAAVLHGDQRAAGEAEIGLRARRIAKAIAVETAAKPPLPPHLIAILRDMLRTEPEAP